MCACDEAPGFTCSQCVGTPFDPRYLEDAHEPMDTVEFDALVTDRTAPRTFGDRGWI